jgi:hypothetical protein
MASFFANRTGALAIRGDHDVGGKGASLQTALLKRSSRPNHHANPRDVAIVFKPSEVVARMISVSTADGFASMSCCSKLRSRDRQLELGSRCLIVHINGNRIEQIPSLKCSSPSNTMWNVNDKIACRRFMPARQNHP